MKGNGFQICMYVCESKLTRVKRNSSESKSKHIENTWILFGKRRTTRFATTQRKKEKQGRGRTDKPNKWEKEKNNDSHSLACWKSFGRSAYEITYFPKRIPAASFAFKTSHLLRNKTKFVGASNGFDTIDFQSNTESSCLSACVLCALCVVCTCVCVRACVRKRDIAGIDRPSGVSARLNLRSKIGKVNATRREEGEKEREFKVKFWAQENGIMS